MMKPRHPINSLKRVFRDSSIPISGYTELVKFSFDYSSLPVCMNFCNI